MCPAHSASRPREGLAHGAGNRSFPLDLCGPHFKHVLAQEVAHQTACSYCFIIRWLPCLRTHEALFILLARRNADGNESGGIMGKSVPGVIFGRLDNCVL